MCSVPGRYLVPYVPSIVGVLELTTPLVVKEASQLTGAIIRNTLRSLTLICPSEYKVRNYIVAACPAGGNLFMVVDRFNL
jgi:hypothetical protein